jgi:hypothetical protein
MVAITFGTVFVLVNSAGLPAPWPLVIRAVGLLVAALLIVGLVLVVGKASSATQAPVSDFIDRRYWLIVALEVGALFGGLAMVNGVLHRTACLSPGWHWWSACISSGLPRSGICRATTGSGRR